MHALRILATCGLLLCGIGSARAEEPVVRRLLLIGQSPDGHPPATHEYLPGQRVLAKCLVGVPQLEVTVVNADEPWTQGPELLAKADGAVIFVSEGARWAQQDPRRMEALARLAQRGGGVVGLHWGLGTKAAENIEGYLRLVGGCHGGPDRKYKVLDTTLRVADRKHPIATALDDFALHEELYYKLKFVAPASSVQPILKAEIDGATETVAWAWERPDGGRSFGYSGLHFHENWQRTECRRLMAQGVLWSLKLPIPKDGLPVQVATEDLQLK